MYSTIWKKNIPVKDFVNSFKIARKLLPTFPGATFAQLIITVLQGSVTFDEINTLTALYSHFFIIIGDIKSTKTLQNEIASVKQFPVNIYSFSN